MVEETDHGEMHTAHTQKWVGKDYYNPFIKDFTELHEPLSGKYVCDCMTACIRCSCSPHDFSVLPITHGWTDGCMYL